MSCPQGTVPSGAGGSVAAEVVPVWGMLSKASLDGLEAHTATVHLLQRRAAVCPRLCSNWYVCVAVLPRCLCLGHAAFKHSSAAQADGPRTDIGSGGLWGGVSACLVLACLGPDPVQPQPAQQQLCTWPCPP